jgi:nucleoside phosphorylase/CheY-like chemotaxis protein
MNELIKVLVVEDNPKHLEILVALVEEGLRVVSCFPSTNVAEAKRESRDLGNDLSCVVLDLKIPRAEGKPDATNMGLELVRFWRADPRWQDVPLVIVTGEWNDVALPFALEKLHPFKLILKPKDMDDLTVTGEIRNQFKFRLGEAISNSVELRELAKGSTGQVAAHPAEMKREPTSVDGLGIFVALEEERKMLTELWNLHKTRSDSKWTGRVRDVEVELFGPGSIGRVPAAVETMSFLQSTRPRLLLVLGLGGGFGEGGVCPGDVLVATQIPDLASRKVGQSGGRSNEQIRPEGFRVANQVRKGLDHSAFKSDKWGLRVAKEGAWNVGTYPAVRFGPIASVDEVVSSNARRSVLLSTWPKLVGVEMEAGGVCAAAERFGVPVDVIRGVSDLADADKTDDDWRRKALIAAARLVEEWLGSWNELA